MIEAMSKDSTCQRASRWFRHCKWEAVYDTSAPSDELANAIRSSWSLPQWLAELGVVRSIYVGSMCSTCGRYEPRQDDGEQKDGQDSL
jgi:hypothetical protein